ncbi:MAG: hypothetical protein B0A82_08425 [Alkalinema sp. CACIAM 70d]|nr:MAG: hypothetical protein B0A82_08425 [Alkalinema sp. CACIAM 70d]
MDATSIKQRITQKLNNLDIAQLTLVDNLLTQLTAYLNPTQSTTETADPLASLRNSDFIGCIADDPDLAANSEEIAHQILSQTQDQAP